MRSECTLLLCLSLQTNSTIITTIGLIDIPGIIKTAWLLFPQWITGFNHTVLVWILDPSSQLHNFQTIFISSNNTYFFMYSRYQRKVQFVRCTKTSTEIVCSMCLHWITQTSQLTYTVDCRACRKTVRRCFVCNPSVSLMMTQKVWNMEEC